MSTKRSVSPASSMDENTNKQARTEEGRDPPSSVETSEGEESAAPPDSSDVDAEKKGTRVEELKSIKVMYEEGTTLKGWPADEQDAVLYPFKAELNDKVYLWQGDITTLEIDCIVNAANKSLLGGGGVDGAIHAIAGPRLMTECSKLNGCETGQTKLTSGHSLPSKHVAHTVGPIYHSQGKKESEKLLRSCYRTTLELCEEEGIKSVAFSGISTGIYGYPKDDAARVACDEVRKFLDSEKGANIDAIIFCSFQAVDTSSYVDNVPSYFPPPPAAAKEKKTEEPKTGEEGSEEGEKEKKDETAKAPGTGKVPEGKASARKTGHMPHAGGAKQSV